MNKTLIASDGNHNDPGSVSPGYHPVCEVSEIPNGAKRTFSVGGKEIILFNINRQYYAILNQCTHLDQPLADGRQIGCEIICRQHGARFDIRDGRVLGGPAVKNLETFPVRILDGVIEVCLD